MRTKPARSDEERIRAFHEKLDRPSIVSIAGATLYWLERDDGRRIGKQSPTSEAPLLAALAEIRRGVDPIGLSLVCNAPDHGRYVITTGDFLVEFAESAAGIPARPRMPAAGELPGIRGERSLARPVRRKADSLPTASPGSGSSQRRDQ